MSCKGLSIWCTCPSPLPRPLLWRHIFTQSVGHPVQYLFICSSTNWSNILDLPNITSTSPVRLWSPPSLPFFFQIRIMRVESIWVHSTLRPPVGLLCQPRVIMMMDSLVEWWLAGETQVLGENLPQCHFVHHKLHMPARTRTRAAAVGSQRLTAWAPSLQSSRYRGLFPGGEATWAWRWPLTIISCQGQEWWIYK
jgi:hypothetical protein